VIGLDHYSEIWLVDFEFCCPPGETQTPICMVAHEYRSGRLLRLWADELAAMTEPPFPIDENSLFVAYYASAELGCFLSLGWPMPVRNLDLFTEFRCCTNGLPTACGNGLLGALAHFGLDAMAGSEKESMRDLAIRGGPFTETEKHALLDYCQSDVDALAKLLPKMESCIDWPRALLRGRYMTAAARMEYVGTPTDTETLGSLREHWAAIQGRLVKEIDKDYGVFIPADSALNLDTQWGQTVADVAASEGIDPHALAEAVNLIWKSRKEFNTERRKAIATARKATGLTLNRIGQWEDKGRDSSTYPGLDVSARDLAGQLPALGISTGYRQNENYDDTDYSGHLWEVLREPTPSTIRRDDPEVLAEALAMIEASDTTAAVGLYSFSVRRWAEWLAANDIPWPRLDTGALDLTDDTFRQMAKQHPEVSPMRELRHTLSQMRLNELAVGSDGRNRCLLSAFRARTSRNQPSNSKFIFGPSCWLRGLIKPEPGTAVAYVDWSQQEFGIAAALSGDTAMMAAYESGDPYLAFAKQASAVPQDATKETHGQQRSQFKVCALAVQYGMGSKSLATSLGESEAKARELLRLHRETFPKFWAWSEAAVNHAMLRNWLQTVFGWRIHVGPNVNPRSLANFPMQGNGAEMLRLACCLATERGVRVCAPVHDALLVEGPAEEIEEVVSETQATMQEASEIVLSGFRLRTDAEIVRHPDRYMDDRGEKMWATVGSILDNMTTVKAKNW